jgi:type VII secretion protein EccE
MPIQLLDAEGLLDALAQACALGTGERSRAAREDWGAWATARLAHACFWVRQWPAAHAAGALPGALAGTLAATTVAVMLEPGEDGIELRCLVRVSAPANQLAAACAAVSDAAERAGARLFRLDGEQAPAVYATAPTGGGAR